MSSVSTENPTGKDQPSNRLSFLTLFSSTLLLRSFVFSGLIFFSIVLGGWPQQVIWPVLLISFGVGLVAAFVYGKMMTERDAGQGLYIYLKNRLGQLGAFITTLLLFVIGNVFIGFLISFLPKYIFSELFTIVGMGNENRLLVDIGTALTNPQVIALFGIVLVVTAFVITSLSKAVFPKVFIVSVILLLLIGVILFLQFGLPVNAAFDAVWDGYEKQPVFAEVVDQAQEAGINDYIFGGMYSLAALSVGLWIFMMGYETVNLNVFFKKRNAVWINLVSVSVSFLFLAGFTIFLVNQVGFPWLRAQAYLGITNPAVFSGWLTTYAALLAPHPIYFLFIILFLLLTTISMLGVSLITHGVFIQSWAEDDLIPKLFLLKNRSNGKTSIPFLLASFLFGVGVVLSAFSSTIIDVVGFVIVLQLTQIPILFAATFLKKSDNPRGDSKFKIAAGIVLFSVVFSLVLFVITPVPNGFIPWLGMVVAGITFLLGLLYFFLLRHKLIVEQ